MNQTSDNYYEIKVRAVNVAVLTLVVIAIKAMWTDGFGKYPELSTILVAYLGSQIAVNVVRIAECCNAIRNSRT